MNNMLDIYRKMGCGIRKHSIRTGFILLLLAHAWRNNTMMAYVEDNAFDGNGI